MKLIDLPPQPETDSHVGHVPTTNIVLAAFALSGLPYLRGDVNESVFVIPMMIMAMFYIFNVWEVL